MKLCWTGCNHLELDVRNLGEDKWTVCLVLTFHFLNALHGEAWLTLICRCELSKLLFLKEAWVKVNTVELHLSGLIGMISHPDNWISLWKYATLAVWSGKNFYKQLFLATYLFIYNKTLIHNSLYVFDSWGKNETIKRCSTITVWKCLPEGSSHSG